MFLLSRSHQRTCSQRLIKPDRVVRKLGSALGFPGGSAVKNLPARQEVSLEEGMATHSSILAWRVPRTEEPGGAAVHVVAKESDTAERLRHSLEMSLVQV